MHGVAGEQLAIRPARVEFGLLDGLPTIAGPPLARRGAVDPGPSTPLEQGPEPCETDDWPEHSPRG